MQAAEMISRARVGRSLSWSCCLCYFKARFSAGIPLARLVLPFPLAVYLRVLLLGIWVPTGCCCCKAF